MKIRRNASCPCGSGKKHKKCCIDKPQQVYTTQSMIEKEEQINPFFAKYNSFDLLQSIAGLTILPENHGKYVRMELITLEVVRSYNSSEEIASPEILKTFLDKEYPANHQEDPPVNLFTDLITFYGGDYLIFPGITENGNFILSNLLAAVFHWPDSNIPKRLRTNCHHVTMLLLTISNIVATRLGYKRYQSGEANVSEIDFPNIELLQNLKSAVTYTEQEMEQLLEDNLIAKQALNKFLIDINSPDFKTQHIEDSPLLYNPIMFTEGNYLIVSPATLSFALTHFIWAEAERMGCMKEVNEAYQSILWNNIQLHLDQMRFKWINLDGIPNETNLPIKDGIYRFDDDKIAYVNLIFDSGLNFNKKERARPKEIFERTESIDKHKEETIAKILALPEYMGFQILDLTMTSPIGRDFYFPIRKMPNTRILAIPVFEFDVLGNLKDTDAIDLWKFAIAREEQLLETKAISFSFLDQYKIFKDHNDSFYLSDETKYNLLQIQPGYSAEMVRESKLITDKHSVLRDVNGRLANVQIEMKDKYAPVYIDLMGLASSELEFLVEGFHQPMWVTPIPDGKNITGELRHMFWEINDAISYWLWQIQDEIKDDLKPLGGKPLTASFDLIPKEKFETIERNFTREANLSDKFLTAATQTTFSVIIPSEIIPYLYGSDNEGERILVKNLLLAINKLLTANKLRVISDEKICQIVESRAPLGMKKKFFILDTSDNLLLDPRNLKKYRYVQEYDTGIVLNSIVPALGNLCPPVGELTTKKEKNDLAFKIVQNALLPMLREKINPYNSTILLEKLIGLNESLIRKREELRIYTPTRIACFVSVEQHQIDLQRDLGNVNKTTLAVRCLIEHIAAEPSIGNKIVSKTGIDELVAIMYQVISWGSLGDQIHFDLFDISMGILPTGRIGTEKTQIKEIFDPYHSSKTKENVTDAISTFNQVFPQIDNIKGLEVPSNLDKAFKTDYGISFSRICEFIEGLTYIGFSQSTPFASFPLNELNSEINNYVAFFDNLEFQSAIIYLGLENRGKLENLPKGKGYEFIDIMPWRFNRMLSLLRKPLVIVNRENAESNKIVYWGVRQMLSSRKYLGDQCMSDRLRVLEGSEVKKVLGKFAQKRGDALVKTVVDSINSKGLIIDTDVYIGPNYSLKNDIDIGDIDVLIIDSKNKILFSLECKSMSPSRNIKEMIDEIDKLFGSESQKGWLSKHIRRHEWVEKNKKEISAKYNLDISDFQIKSFFITQEDMLTPYLKKQTLAIPFVTCYEIEKEGINILIKKI